MKVVKSISIDAHLAQQAEKEKSLSGLVNALLAQHYATEAGLSDAELEEKRLRAMDELVGAKAEQERRHRIKEEAEAALKASDADEAVKASEREERRAKYAAEIEREKQEAGEWLDSLAETEREAIKLDYSETTGALPFEVYLVNRRLKALKKPEPAAEGV